MKRKHLFLRGWIRQCFTEIYINSQSKIIIAYISLKKLKFESFPGIILSLAFINNLTNGQVYYPCHNPFSATVSLSLFASLLSAHPFPFHIKDMSAEENISLNKHFSTNVVVLIYTGSYMKLPPLATTL
jgi:hypothetical protein